MANPRFLVPELAPAPGAAPAASGVAVLPEAASHHARRVLRLRPGDAVTLFDGWELIHAISPDLTLYGIALAYTNHHIRSGE